MLDGQLINYSCKQREKRSKNPNFSSTQKCTIYYMENTERGSSE